MLDNSKLNALWRGLSLHAQTETRRSFDLDPSYRSPFALSNPATKEGESLTDTEEADLRVESLKIDRLKRTRMDVNEGQTPYLTQADEAGS